MAIQDGKKKIEYGLIGYPLVHSFSCSFFNEKFESEGINAEYINFEIDSIEKLHQVIENHPNLRGLNVTIPYKQQVIPYLDEIDEAAREIGAVNVIKITRDAQGKAHLKGYNSDVVGFADSIKPLLKSHHTSALVLGSGGASQAVRYALKQLGVESQVVSRRKTAQTVTYEELTKQMMKSHTVIVNTTPLGMYPHCETFPEINYNHLTSNHLCYDLIYNPDETMFMKKSAEHGAVVKNGLEMLLLQAFVSYQMWND